ncbi:MAG: bifunctional UDP-N-acetylglucosamine diphosphorylase/glucosamine-1-phosphate N-acetyltransferase GlmU [Coriobacteriia bacterium]|nr:bifunctional UDP-N-acetylglucosamine diphosphorylase/glucosamine-1-phosphate N-acetyltransferase GlmU [Coriobacteriia bacterium]
MNAAAIILAAGAGTRMKSRKPKVAHEILGKPLVRWVVDAAHAAGLERVVAVVGHCRDQVEPLLVDAETVVQEEQLGTAHAVNMTRDAVLGKADSVVVLTGDSPLVTPETIAKLVSLREGRGAGVVVLTMIADDPTGYGRIVRDQDGQVAAIVEQKDCTPEQAAITECNSGFYCFDTELLFDALGEVSTDNAQGEYYLTDVLAIARSKGREVLGLVAEDGAECLGVNSRRQLAEATRLLQARINARHMDAGVTLWDPASTFIGPDVQIEQDVEILPQSYLLGSTKVATGCVIGPNSRLTDTCVGANCVIDETVAKEAVIDEDVECGPRAYLRPATHMCKGSKAGTHVEIKKSTIGEGSKVPHLSYIGDCTMGSGVNIGAGSITCNYDGKAKWPTVIEDDVFVGSDTMMVAPVTLGRHCLVAAGSVVTKDASPESLVLGRARQVEKEGWNEGK